MKRYDLFYKGKSTVRNVETGANISILGGYNQVPVTITRVMIDGDLYTLPKPLAANVGARPKITLQARRDYKSDVTVTLIVEQTVYEFIGPANELQSIYARKICSLEGNDPKKYKETKIQAALGAEIINNDYFNADFRTISSGSTAVFAWYCPDDIPVKIKGIEIVCENKEDEKFLQVNDLRVGRDSQFMSADILPLEALKYFESDTVNVGVMVSLQITSNKPLTEKICETCNHVTKLDIPIGIRGYVLVDTGNDQEETTFGTRTASSNSPYR